jgi:alcohol dehydrogenase (cytochrome c)
LAQKLQSLKSGRRWKAFKQAYQCLGTLRQTQNHPYKHAGDDQLKRNLLSILIMAATAHAGAQVTDAMIANDASSAENVLSWGMGSQGQRHSTLTDVNAKTISRLVPAWSMSFGGEKQRGQESQPLVHNGKMFVTASYSRIFALDSKTGAKLWKYEHRLPEGIMPCCDVINRGAALYDNLVIFGTLDAQLVALDQTTGKVVWREKIDDYSAGYSYSAAPLIAEGLLITGLSGGEFGVVGRVEARDPKTGKLVWSRPTVEGHMGTLNGQDNGITGTTNATWPGETWKTGGATPWLGGTYDAKTGLAYFGTGNPGPWNSHVRKGDNLFSASTIAIDVKTGKIVWHYQNTPNDGWDYDGVNEFITFDMDGKRMGAKADRNGFFYVNDAVTGKLVNAFPFVKKTTWASSIDLKTGRPNLIEENRPGDPTAPGMDGKKGKTAFAAPGFLGGKNQMPMAYSPKTGLFYVPTNEWGMDIWNEPIAYKKGAAYLGAGFTIKPLFDDHIGSLRAIDPKTGKVAWEVKNTAPLWGGVMTTGDLVFWGTPEGYLKAADAKTGKVVWQFQTGSGIVAPPITWKEGGQQYVSVVSGWGGAVPLWGGEVAKKVNLLEQGGSVWTFKLIK